MKRILFLASLLWMGTCQMNAQVQKQKVSVSEVKAQPTTKADNYAEIEFEKLSHDFGKFSKNDPIVKCTFKFKNTGTAPLIIQQAFASCGCTVPTPPTEPIKPGESNVIDVTYNGTDKFPGHFKKTITIRTNAVKGEVVRLTIEGDM